MIWHTKRKGGTGGKKKSRRRRRRWRRAGRGERSIIPDRLL